MAKTSRNDRKMNRRNFVRLCAGGSAIAISSLATSATAAPIRPLKHRWFYSMHNLAVPANVDELMGIMRRATRAGYNGVVLDDFKFNKLETMGSDYFSNVGRIKSLAKQLGLEIIPCVFPIGYSEGLLFHNPNLVEGLPAKNELFLVQNGKANVLPDPATTIRNGDFEKYQGNRLLEWDMQDYPGVGTFIDTDVKRSGLVSLRFENIGAADPQYGHGRIMQKVLLAPYHYYHLSFWSKTTHFDTPGNVQAEVLTTGKPSRNLNYVNLNIQSTQDWTEQHVMFNSLENSEALIYLGVWNGKNGTMWLDDVRLETAGLINVVRRDGCPLSVKGEDGTLYREGSDFEPVRDPRMGNVPWPGSFELYHTPPPIVPTPSSRIKEGDRLLVSFYHPAFIYSMQTTCCLTHPKVYALLDDQMHQIEKLFHPSFVFMDHDEIRIANWCELCRRTGLTPGQLLADNVRRCHEIIRKYAPQAGITVWSDMFDPYHNAVDNYYLANGSWAGSWKGLSPDVTTMDWVFELCKKDMPFFAKQGHKQMISCNCDMDTMEHPVSWLKDSMGIDGVTGAMYTTWEGKYDKLERFAQRVWGGAA